MAVENLEFCLKYKLNDHWVCFVIVKVKGWLVGNDATESLLFGPSVSPEHEMFTRIHLLKMFVYKTVFYAQFTMQRQNTSYC